MPPSDCAAPPGPPRGAPGWPPPRARWCGWGGDWTSRRTSPSSSPPGTTERMLDGCLPPGTTDYPPSTCHRRQRRAHRGNEQWYADSFAELDLKVGGGPAAVQLLGGQQRRRRAARGGARVPQRRHRDARPGLAEGAGRLGHPARIGCAGLQLSGDGEIQHAGVVLGLNGFADHLFEGMRRPPVAPRPDHVVPQRARRHRRLRRHPARAASSEIGGFDERFILCGSDVALGLDAVMRGPRNVCSPFTRCATSNPPPVAPTFPPGTSSPAIGGTTVAVGGDPYFSPNMSLLQPRARASVPHIPPPRNGRRCRSAAT